MFGVLSHVGDKATRMKLLRRLRTFLADSSSRIILSVPNQLRRFKNEDGTFTYDKNEPGNITYSRTYKGTELTFFYHLYTPETLEELIKLIKPKRDRFYVKIMEPNHTSSIVESHKEDLGIEKTYSMEEFQGELEKEGIHATLFKSKGIDVRAGCGMMTVRGD